MGIVRPQGTLRAGKNQVTTSLEGGQVSNGRKAHLACATFEVGVCCGLGGLGQGRGRSQVNEGGLREVADIS